MIHKLRNEPQLSFSWRALNILCYKASCKFLVAVFIVLLFSMHTAYANPEEGECQTFNGNGSWSGCIDEADTYDCESFYEVNPDDIITDRSGNKTCGNTFDYTRMRCESGSQIFKCTFAPGFYQDSNDITQDKIDILSCEEHEDEDCDPPNDADPDTDVDDSEENTCTNDTIGNAGELDEDPAVTGNDDKTINLNMFRANRGGQLTDVGVNEYEVYDACKRNLDDFINPSMCQKDGERIEKQVSAVENNYVPVFILMAQELSSVLMKHTEIIGQFFDAEQQLKTQRQIQELAAAAHKDYHPSDQMCRIGTFMNGVARSDIGSAVEKNALNKVSMARFLSKSSTTAAGGTSVDVAARLRQFREVYCDPDDNNANLTFMCQHDQDDPNVSASEDVGGEDPSRFNKDIDIARTVLMPLTLDIAMRNPNRQNLDDSLNADEEDVMALARNLYWPITFDNVAQGEAIEGNKEDYLLFRRMVAMHNIAQNSYLSLVAAKSANKIVDEDEQSTCESNGGEDTGDAANPCKCEDSSGNTITCPEDGSDGDDDIDISDDEERDSSAEFMRALLKEFGMADDEIFAYLGENPSYYAQMEILTKKLYQHPDFYTNLIDKPANVRRIGVALDAIRLMQMRDSYQSNLRREMLTSLLVEEKLMQEQIEIDKVIGSEIGRRAR